MLYSGPTCKTMVELTDAKVFKSTAFKPSDEELSRNLKSRREKKRSRAVFKDDSSDSESNSDVDMVSAKVAPKDFDDLLADSDDDLPDAFAILGKTKEETPPKKKARRDDVSRYEKSDIYIFNIVTRGRRAWISQMTVTINIDFLLSRKGNQDALVGEVTA